MRKQDLPLQRLLNKDGRRLEVSIPPGVRTGSKVRMRGEGGPGVAGDCLVSLCARRQDP